MAIHWNRIFTRLWHIAAIVIIVAAVLVSASRFLTPYFNEHIPDVENWISRSLKTPVTINKVYLSWNVYEPVLSFDDVKFYDPVTKKPKFQVEHVSVDLNLFRSLFNKKLTIGTISISGVQITIQQNPSGEMNIEGFEVSDNRIGSATTAEEVAKWIFSIPNLELRNIDVHYRPNKGVVLSFLVNSLMLGNDNKNHTLSGHIILNQEVPTRITTRLNWEGEATDVKHITGNLYVYLQGLSLPQWFDQKTWHDLSVKQGLGSTKIWADLKDSVIQKVQMNLQFYELELKSQKTLKSIVIPRVSGNFGWRREGDKQIYAGDQIFIDLSDHLWPETAFSISLMPDASGNLSPTTMQVKYIDVADAANILTTTGILPDDVQQKLHALNPKGEIKNIQAAMQGVTFDPQHVQVNATFNGLSLNPEEKIPGVNNLTGTISWDGKTGALQLNSQNTSLILNQLFTENLQFENVTGTVKLAKEDDGSWLLQVVDLMLANADVKLRTNLKVVTPVNQSPQINLAADFQVMNAKHIYHYIPLKVLDPGVGIWLHNAFSSGEITSGTAVIQGSLADFPFDNQKGIFSVNTNLSNIDLTFAPGWPVLRNLNGKLVFSRRSMTVDLTSGNLLNIPLGAIHAEIPYFGDAAPQIVNVQTTVSTDFANALSFVHNSPLEKTIGSNLGAMTLTGPMQLKLDLSVPLSKPEQTKVQGDITTANATLGLPQWKLSLEKLQGMLHFTETDLTAPNLQAKLFGEDAILDIATQHPANAASFVQANLKSQLSVAALQTWMGVTLDSVAQGKAAFTAELHLYSQDQTSEVTSAIIRSDLVGMSLDLPESLGKKPDDVRNLQIDLTTGKQLRAKIDYNKSISAALQYSMTSQGLSFVNGEVSLGGQAQWQQQPGLVLSGKFKQLNWDTVQQRLNGKSVVNVSMLRKIHLDINTFIGFGQQLNGVHADISKPENSWLIDVNSQELAGEITVPTGQSPQPIEGKFDRIYLKPSNGGKTTVVDPRKIPSLNINAHEVRFGDKNLGAVTITAAHTPTGLVIHDLRVESSLVNLHAQGEWLISNGKYTSHLNGVISTAHASDLLKAWGYGTDNFVGSKGDVNFDLTWQGAPYGITVNGLYGSMSLSLGKGQIINLSESNNAKMDLGRLLNVFSISSIPRRLSLDFSDVVEKGYGFDYVKGDFTLKNGNAYTDKIRIDGPIAHVSISGKIGLAAQDFDLIMNVTPYVTSSLPVVAAVATGLNPLAGVATWAISKVMSKAVSNVVTYHYSVKGPWANPVWGQVNKSQH